MPKKPQTRNGKPSERSAFVARIQAVVDRGVPSDYALAFGLFQRRFARQSAIGYTRRLAYMDQTLLEECELLLGLRNDGGYHRRALKAEWFKRQTDNDRASHRCPPSP
jgi:hypothetical protein